MKSDYFHSVILEDERCIGCTYCLKVCPTEAIRIKDGKASIIGERCIDCGECIRICPNHAKNVIADNLDIIKKFKFTIALTLPVLYGQFSPGFTPSKIMSALKSLGFDRVCDTSLGSEISGIVTKHIIEQDKRKPIISSSCPAILRLIQVRFPELLGNVLDMETPVEIAARLEKHSVSKELGIDLSDIGIVLITPCTARVTSIRKPLGIDHSYIDGAISIKDIYVPMLKALSSNNLPDDICIKSTHNGVLSNGAGGQTSLLGDKSTLPVNGIHDAISVLEEIEMGRLSDLSFIALMACPGGCLGGPLTVENRYVALNKIRKCAWEMDYFNPSESEKRQYINMYENGLIKFSKKIEPKSVSRLDADIKKSIEKMDIMENIINNLPGIDCGICGSPTCRAFAEDVVTGNRNSSSCPVANITNNIKRTEGEL